ncbi:acyl-CoA carboxylase subunit beta [Ferrovibrio xuzhouensis]|uniref:Acyl-CoA carboxylase subunit beta n=1 Tax=Ferrovibrio xuzhouensis TaxID=1576914 RepID=A0ABV7VLM2_9PROT
MPHEALLEDFEVRRRRALAMGGPEKLARRRQANVLNARERIDCLVDAGSFLESGLFGTSVMPGDADNTPGDGKIAGFGKIEGREVAVVSNDFTVKGASSSLTNMKKIGHVKRVATQRGLPLVMFGESSGARMPDNMGARGMGTMLGTDPVQYVRQRETPWVSAILGQCYGSSAWYACLSDYVVMRRGAVMAVASPALASMAIGQKVDPEELGGVKLHSETTGMVDTVVDSDEDAIAAIKRFLSYLPGHAAEAPPRLAVPAGCDEAGDGILAALPESRTRVYDVRRIIRSVVDADTFMEVKPQFGKPAVIGMARLDGRSVGIIANNPMGKAGALDVAACEKITRFIVMCDSFNIPLLLFVDTPGFVIGIDGERQKAPGKIMNFMTALQMASVPKLSVMMRKSYGQAYLNMGGGRNSDDIAAWPTAEISFMDPVYAARVVTWGDDDPAERARIEAEMRRDSSAYDLASIYGVQAVIRPQDTRQYLKRMLEIHEMRPTHGIGQRHLRNWPTTY